MSLIRSHKSVIAQGKKVADELMADEQTRLLGIVYGQKIIEADQVYQAARLVKESDAYSSS